jgi:hypothetical protein
VDPVDQPGASKPTPQGGPADTIGEADVEKTLEKLESMTATLVQEVGSVPGASTSQAKGPAPIPAAAPAISGAEGGPVANPSVPAAEAAAASADVPVPQATPPAGSQEAPPGATGEPPVSEAPAGGVTPSAPTSEPAADKGQGGLSAEAEVEQEISQALQQLQGGKATATKATSAAPSETVRDASPSVPIRVLRLVDAIFWPLAVVLTLLDLPFRWLPGLVRQLLGYVAVGTALTAGALWYYIIISHPQ